MKKLSVQLHFDPADPIFVGQLAEHDHRCYFEFDAAFIERGIQPSPFKLALRPGLIEHVDPAIGPLPGLFDDSLPDGWGLLLMDRIFRRRGIDPAGISPFDRLSYLGRRTMGALTYHPPAEVEQDDRLIDLAEVGKNAIEVYSGEAAEILPALARAGGSAGGARPKVLIGVKVDKIISGEGDLPAGFEHWIVKFPAKSEPPDAARVEYAYSLMAHAAGLEMPPTRLFPAGKRQAYFGVKRFDREPGNKRLHVHTFANLIHANFRIPCTDYADLLKAATLLTRKHDEVLRVFRQMIFNIAAHNRDDHAKNFAFIMTPDGQWKVSPAYDLVPTAGPGGEHTTTVAGEGREPTRDHALELGRLSGISRNDIVEMIEKVNAAVERWPRWAEKAGVTKKSSKAVMKDLRNV